MNTPHGENWLFKVNDEIVKFKPKWHFASNNGQALCEMANMGVGVVQVPNITALLYARSGLLQEVLREYRVPKLNIYAIYLQRRFCPPKISSFVRFLKNFFKQSGG